MNREENTDSGCNNGAQLPLVSVVMPAYNHEKYVEAAVRSVWNQDYRPIELIVLDDGSTDGTLRVLRSLEEISPIAMTIVAKENEGICRTLNRALDLARGDYVAFLASDDEFVVNKTSSHVSALELKRADARVAGCYGERCAIDEYGHKLPDASSSAHEFDDHFLSLIRHECTYHLEGATFRLGVVKGLRFDPDLYFEDWDFFIRLTAVYELLYVPGPAFRYRIHDANMSGQNAKASVLRIADARMQIFRKLRDHPRIIKYGVHRFEAHVCAANARRLYATDLFSDARAWLLRAWCSNPASIVGTAPLAIKLLIGSRGVAVGRRLKRRLVALLAFLRSKTAMR